MIAWTYADTDTLAFFGALGIAILLALSVSGMMLPAARRLLDEACRTSMRGMFWTRFVGISLVLSILIGSVFGYVMNDHFGVPRGQGSTLHTLQGCSRMLRWAVQSGAVVLWLAASGASCERLERGA